MKRPQSFVWQMRAINAFVGSPAEASTRLTACFGIACPVHHRCERYAAVDDTQADAGTIGTCRSGTSLPLFLQSGPVVAA